MRKIYILGSINMDIVSSVKAHPQPGETIKSNNFEYLPGGKGSNQAIAAHRLGGDVSLVGKIGSDAFGKELLVFYANEGVDTEMVSVHEGGVTGAAFVAVDKNGENLIYVSGGANDLLKEDDLSEIEANEQSIFSATLETPIDTIYAAFKRAKDAGAGTVLNAAPADTSALKLLPVTDHLIVNEHELALLSGKEEIREDIEVILEEFAEKHNLNIIATLGPDGVCAVIAGEDMKISGRKVDIVDTTGAGDCFVGAFVTALSEGQTMRSSLEFANRAASLSVQKLGAAPSMPFRKEVESIHS